MSTKIRLTFDATGFDLGKLNLRLDDFEAPITAVLEEALADAENTVRVTKDAWPPMAAATIKSGRDPSTLLVASGELADSLARGGPGNIFEADSHSGIAGSAVEHAGFQQFGSEGHPFRPPRPFLLWADERIDDYIKIFREHLVGRR